MLSVGAASVVAGSLWFLLGGSRTAERPRAQVFVSPAAGGAVVGLGGSL